MEAVSSVKELQQHLSTGRSCKIGLRNSEKLRKAIVDAGVVDKLDTGIQLIPRDVTRILLAAICQVGTVVAQAPFEGYGIGLKRKGDDLFLYFSKKTSPEPETPPGES